MHRINRTKQRMALVILLIMPCITVGCGRENAKEDVLILVEQETEEEDFSLGVASRRDIEQSLTINCQYIAANSEGITYDMDGQIIGKVHVKEGDSVVSGQLLVELDKKDVEEQIIELTYTIARNELLYEQILSEKQLEIDIAGVEYSYSDQNADALQAYEERLLQIEELYAYTIEDYEDRLYIDRLKLSQLQAGLKEGKIYAGMSGTVVYLKPDLEGSKTVQDERIITITNSEQCVFTTDRVDTAVYFDEGTSVMINVPVGRSAGDYEVFPILPQNEGDSLRFVLAGEDVDHTQIEVGSRGNVKVVLESRQDALSIQTEALYSADGRYYVYVLNDDGTQQTRWVELGIETKDYVEILSGLEEGDKVILR